MADKTKLSARALKFLTRVGRRLNGRGPNKLTRAYNDFWRENQKTADAINSRVKAAEVEAPKAKAVTSQQKKDLQKKAEKRADSNSGSRKIDERTELQLGKDYVQGGQGGRDYVAATTAGSNASTQMSNDYAALERYVKAQNPGLAPGALRAEMARVKASPEWAEFAQRHGASVERRSLNSSRRNYYNSNRTTVRSQIRQNSIDKSVQRGENRIAKANQAEAEAAKAELVRKAEIERLKNVAAEKKTFYETLQKQQAKADALRSKTTLGRLKHYAPYVTIPSAVLGGAGYGAYKMFWDDPQTVETTPETLATDPSIYSKKGDTWYTGETPSVAGEVGIDRNGNANYFDGNSWQPISQLNQDSSGVYYTPDGTAHQGVPFADRAAGISNVRGLLQALLNNDYKIGKDDGYFGMATLAAVDAYRRKYGTQGLQNLLIQYKKNGGKC